MKWILNMNRQSVLPILFGISLTTFGISMAVLLYNMLEKDDDDNDRKKRGKIATSKRKEVTVQIKIPAKYVSAIIGKGGTVVKNIQELTNTYIKMEKENFSSERVCYIRSDDIENIYSAQNMIQNIINNLPIIETFELFVPFEASKKVFKRNLNTISFVQEIQKSYGAKVIVENNAHKTATGLKRRIILKGTADQIASAIIRIEDKVHEEVEDCSQPKMQFASARMFKHLENADAKDDYSNNEIYDYLVPYEVCKRIIEKDKCTIQEIEKSSGAKIIINDETVAEYEDEEKKVIIRGTAKQVNSVMSLMEIEVQEAHEFRIESNSDVAIKKISESSSCNNDFSMSKVLNSEQDGLMEVYISAMQTPSLFWIQVIGSANVDLQHLVDEMTEYYNNEENRELHILKKITVGQMVAARFQYDGKWYRAEVVSIIKNSTMCQIFFVDYGDQEIISKDDIFELRTDMLSLRQQAVECSLANVKSREDTWNDETIDKFAELVYLATWIPLVAKVRGYKERPVGDGESRRQSSPIPCIDLYDKASNKNIGNELIQLGMAQIEEEVCSTPKSALPYNKCNFPSIPCLPDPFHLE